MSGTVKTRLESALGLQSSLKLHKWLVEDRLKTLARDSLFNVSLHVTDNPRDPYWAHLNLNYSVPIYLQQGNTLGERMLKAVESTLAQNDWVILLGVDCPDLDASYVESAIRELEKGRNLVIGPAEDGGYVLLGLRRVVRDIFYGIDWGTGSVFKQTMSVLDRQGIDSVTLMPLRDLDVIDDYFFYRDRFPALAEHMARDLSLA